VTQWPGVCGPAETSCTLKRLVQRAEEPIHVRADLPRVSDGHPSVVIDAVVRNLKRLYAPMLDEALPEYLASLVLRLPA
jgi:hypothetical protein